MARLLAATDHAGPADVPAAAFFRVLGSRLGEVKRDDTLKTAAEAEALLASVEASPELLDALAVADDDEDGIDDGGVGA